MSYKEKTVTLHISQLDGSVTQASFSGKLEVTFSPDWVYLYWEDGNSETFKAHTIERVTVEIAKAEKKGYVFG